MLGRLIKHEWKNTYKFGLLMLGAMILVTFLGWLAFQTPMWSMESYRMSWMDIMGLLTLVMYAVLLIVVNYGILIYMGVHFYKTMYTDEGYLTHTLPVTKHQILFAKILVSSLWVLFFYLAMYLSIFGLGVTMLSAILRDEYSLSALWREIVPEMGDFFRILGKELGVDVIRWLILWLISLVVSPFVLVTTLFGAISLGQLFSKYRALMAILSYIGILVIRGLLVSMIRSLIAMSDLSSFGGYLNYSADFSSIISLLTAVGLYFVSWYVTSRKLNME